jgi:hypothetical protein
MGFDMVQRPVPATPGESACRKPKGRPKGVPIGAAGLWKTVFPPGGDKCEDESPHQRKNMSKFSGPGCA